ncbi:MAG: GTPase [Aquisalimonadaceae bacterium]
MISKTLPLAVRLGVFAAVLLLFAVLLMLFTGQLLQFQALLDQRPAWQRWLVWGLVLLLLGVVGAVSARLLFRKSGGAERGPSRPTPDRAELQRRLDDYAARGMDVEPVRQELRTLDERRHAGEIVVAVFGEVSTGKSALVRALVPDAIVASDVLAGTTRGLINHDWIAPGGARVRLVDMPGLQDLDASLEAQALDEARRAHGVLFVTQGDLHRTEWRWLELLRGLDKPLVVAVNKMDRYQPEALTLIRDRVQGRLGDAVAVVMCTAGGEQEVLRRLPDGSEQKDVRHRPAEIRDLRRALQQVLDADPEALEQLRDQAVFLLAAGKLEQAVRGQRRDAADALVERYSRRAVVGALAAVAPGSDLVIQGALAGSLVRDLCALYDVPVRTLEVDRILGALRGRMSVARPVVMGIAGNACKAFPGLGTLAGGVIHAVAYGLLFRTVGLALTQTLEETGMLAEETVLRRFEELTREDLAAPAKQLARAAYEKERQTGTDRPE